MLAVILVLVVGTIRLVAPNAKNAFPQSSEVSGAGADGRPYRDNNPLLVSATG
jgi:hypothetical protein